VFVRSDSTWVLQQQLTASDSSDLLQLGVSAAISGDTAVLGTPHADNPSASSSGAAYVFVRSGSTWTEQARITAADTSHLHEFGISVDVGGDTIVVGATGDDSGGVSAGATYVFVRSGSSWTQEAKIVASDASRGDRFGSSVSISGDSVLIGAHSDDDHGFSSGSAYVFVRSGGAWHEQAKLTASDSARDDLFGGSVSVSGDTAVVGAEGDDEDGNASGSAYVFVRFGEIWNEQARLGASDAASDAVFGSSVSIEDDTILIGASGAEVGGMDSGAAYVFERSGTTWTEQLMLTGSAATFSGQLGFSVALSGRTAVVGAPHIDDDRQRAGTAYVFEGSGSAWTEEARLVGLGVPAKAHFGASVSISNNTAVVGSSGDSQHGAFSGAAYVYLRSHDSWSLHTKLAASDASDGAHFGATVSVSADTIVVGAPGDDDFGESSGAAYVFVRSGAGWAQEQKLVSDVPFAGDSFGGSVSISGDTVAVGRDYWAASHGPGSVLVFVRSGSRWSQQTSLFAWQTPDSRFGSAVALDGHTLVVGNPGDSDVGPDSGSVYFFTRSGATWSPQSKVIASDARPSALFGFSVAILGDTTVVGAPGDLPDGIGSYSGSAYVLVHGDNEWTEDSKLTPSDGADDDEFGGSVAVDGDTVVVGAPHSLTNPAGTGSAYVFERLGTGWSETFKLLVSDAALGDRLGFSVSASSSVIFLAAPDKDRQIGTPMAGAVYIFMPGFPSAETHDTGVSPAKAHMQSTQ